MLINAEQTVATPPPPPAASIVDLAPGGLLSLDSADRLLIVASGVFEVYVLIGPIRHFLAEVGSEGAVLFGGGPKGRLIVLAPNGGRLQTASLRDLADLCEDPGRAGVQLGPLGRGG